MLVSWNPIRLDRPGCEAPIGTIIALTALRSVSLLNLPDFFCIMNTREFQVLKDSIIYVPCSVVH